MSKLLEFISLYHLYIYFDKQYVKDWNKNFPRSKNFTLLRFDFKTRSVCLLGARAPISQIQSFGVCVFICTLGERVWGRCGSTLAEKAHAAGVQIKSRGVAQVQMIAERASQSHSLSAVAAFDLVAKKNPSWQLLNGMYDPC